MDGTSALFEAFLKALPEADETKCLIYPADVSTSYAQLVRMVEFASPEDAPFVIIAESYSTPIAILFAASAPANLKAIILCAGFASSPLSGWRRWVARALAPALFRVPVPRRAIRRFLVGGDAPQELVDNVRMAIREAQPRVLVTRLNEVLRCDVRGELAKVATPVLAIRAEADKLLDRACAEEIARLRPNTIFETVAAPHLLLQRCPNEVAVVVTRFLGKLER